MQNQAASIINLSNYDTNANDLFELLKWEYTRPSAQSVKINFDV